MLKSITFRDTYFNMYEYIKKSYEELYEDNEPDNVDEDYFLLTLLEILIK